MSLPSNLRILHTQSLAHNKQHVSIQVTFEGQAYAGSVEMHWQPDGALVCGLHGGIAKRLEDMSQAEVIADIIIEATVEELMAYA